MDRLRSAQLRGVEKFWRVDDLGDPVIERVLPTGLAQVAVDLDTGAATLVGPRTRSAIVRRPRRAAGFSLLGSGLARIVGQDAPQLVDTAIDLDDLGLAGSRGPIFESDADLHLFAARLTERFDVAEPIERAEVLLRSGFSASSVASQLGFNRRTFVPAFRAQVGLAPKKYETLRRLQRTNMWLRSRPDTPLATAAHHLGFTDQSHMSREVLRLTGHTPSQIRDLQPGPVNHAPVDVATV